jgi:hypothetical protein
LTTRSLARHVTIDPEFPLHPFHSNFKPPFQIGGIAIVIGRQFLEVPVDRGSILGLDELSDPFGEMMSEAGAGMIEIPGAAGAMTLALPPGVAGGDAVNVAFRPENADISFAPPAEGTERVLQGVVERLNFQGGISECHLRIGGALVRILLHPSIEAAQGSLAWLRLKPEGCVVFAAGRRAAGSATINGGLDAR